MKNSIQMLIDNFLKEKRGSDGGWAKVTDEDISKLKNIVWKLIKEKCEPDPDGDYPIQYKIINRRKYERDHYLLIPYLEHNNSSYQEILEDCNINLQIAAYALDITCKLIRISG